MELKIIWIPLLIIGILSSYQSCDKEVDKAHYEEYYFVNESDYEIVIETMTKTDDELYENLYKLGKGNDNTFFQEVEIMAGSVTGIIVYSDSVVVRFGDTKRVSFLPGMRSSFNIIDKHNYTVDEKSEHHHEYKYVFTNDDYENASSYSSPEKP